MLSLAVGWVRSKYFYLHVFHYLVKLGSTFYNLIRYYSSYPLYNNTNDCVANLYLWYNLSEIKLSMNPRTFFACVMTINLETRRAWRGDKGGSLSIAGTFITDRLIQRSSSKKQKLWWKRLAVFMSATSASSLTWPLPGCHWAGMCWHRTNLSGWRNFQIVTARRHFTF